MHYAVHKHHLKQGRAQKGKKPRETKARVGQENLLGECLFLLLGRTTGIVQDLLLKEIICAEKQSNDGGGGDDNTHKKSNNNTNTNIDNDNNDDDCDDDEWHYFVCGLA